MSFEVDRVSIAKEQIIHLGRLARGFGKLSEFKNHLRQAVKQLESEPGDWGDPLYRTRREGGMVRRGLLGPLVFHYVVFEPERQVILLRVIAFPGSFLDV